MSSRTFLILIATVLIMITLFYTTPNDFDGVDQSLFLPDLKGSINDVEEVTITAAENDFVVTLQRGEAQWTVTERSGFVADVGKIRRNLIALSEAQIVEAKTADPAFFDRLGVQDLDQPDASGTRIDLGTPDQTISLIVGETGVRGKMAYVRLVDSDQSYLVSADLDLGNNMNDWIDQELMNISPADVHSVTITHPDGDSLKLEKPDREAAGFIVLGIPDDRELSYATIADPIGGLLTALTLEDVTAATDFDLSQPDPVVARFETFDGMVIEADAYQLDDGVKVQFRVTADQGVANKFMETDATSDDIDTNTDDSTFSSTETIAAELNAKLEPWVFTLPTFKSDQLTKKMADLLK